jgi:hypothetical protein
MRKKETNTLLILGAVAVAGYLAFRSGGFLNNKPAIAMPTPSGGTPIPRFSNPNDIGIYPVDIPKPADIGIYVPTLDPTGQSLQLF